MKKNTTITTLNEIKDLLDSCEYGTLALCFDNKPYCVPLNFVVLNDKIYFHGAKKGKKIELIKQNSYASFTLVKDISFLPSYFSTDDKTACVATHLFKSAIIDGKIKIIQEHTKKAEALQALMNKLQKEKGFISLDNKNTYEKAIKNTNVFELTILQITYKYKIGQNFTKQRYERVCQSLKMRGTKKDLETLKLIQEHTSF